MPRTESRARTASFRRTTSPPSRLLCRCCAADVKARPSLMRILILITYLYLYFYLHLYCCSLVNDGELFPSPKKDLYSYLTCTYTYTCTCTCTAAVSSIRILNVYLTCTWTCTCTCTCAYVRVLLCPSPEPRPVKEQPLQPLLQPLRHSQPLRRTGGHHASSASKRSTRWTTSSFLRRTVGHHACSAGGHLVVVLI